MNKILISIILALAFILTACGSALPANAAIQNATATQAPVVGQTTNTGSLTTGTSGSTNALPIEGQLLLGTFKLEGTRNSVTAAQARVLLPLWQQIQSLSPSTGPGAGNASQTTPAAPAQTKDSTKQTQIDGLVKQVQAGMTSDQLQAITAMQLTQDSVMTFLQSQGISMGGPGAGSGNGQQPARGNPPSGNGQQPQEVTRLPATDSQQPRGTPRPGI